MGHRVVLLTSSGWEVQALAQRLVDCGLEPVLIVREEERKKIPYSLPSRIARAILGDGTVNKLVRLRQGDEVYRTIEWERAMQEESTAWLEAACQRMQLAPRWPASVPQLVTPTLNGSASVERVREAQPDVLVVYSTSLLRKPLLAIPMHGTLNGHSSLLPNYRGARVKEAATFIEFVDGRAFVSLLVETAAAAIRLHEIIKLPGIGEIHFGLNDMYLDMQLANHFEVLTSGFLDRLTGIASTAGVPYGFAGIGRPNDSRLPRPSDLIYAQYPRLGATRPLVARVFYTPDFRALNLTHEVNAARAMLDHWHQAGADQQVTALELLRTKVAEWVA